MERKLETPVTKVSLECSWNKSMCINLDAFVS